jgi:2-dehydro-3-deoxyphosphooctonate aldolase (KDO 8-P synthase)
MESSEMVMNTAATLKKICAAHNIPLIFKSSFDKANRTAGDAPRGLGMETGLQLLAAVRDELSLPVLTDVHWPTQAAEVAKVADVLQIPAFLCRQTDLVSACAATGRAVLIKKGQFLAPQDMTHIAAKAQVAGAKDVLLCERGASFGYNNLVADMRSLVVMRQTGCPVVFDATHSAQLPGAGDGKSSGAREMVLPLAQAAVAVGVNGLFVETHPNPSQAISDAATQWPLDQMDALLRSITAIDRARQTH